MSLRQPQPLSQPSPFPLLLHKERGKAEGAQGRGRRPQGLVEVSPTWREAKVMLVLSTLPCPSCSTTAPQVCPVGSVAHSIPVAQGPHSCWGLCLDCLSATAPSHPFLGYWPKNTQSWCGRSAGLPLQGGDSGEFRVTLKSVWKAKRGKKRD